ncbi:MAG: DNA polymerase III subunit alpha, partial [Lachnospiraceae bacterium]|nr:DNA polymerase III subunit alpha [Lachnospiraceae bacterium]
ILLCIQTAKKLSDEDRMRYDGGQFYVKSEDEMRSLFLYAPEALDNTAKIASRCNVTIEFGHTRLPRFEVPEGYDSWTYLNYLCKEGMKERFPDDDGTIARRLDYELDTIRNMGYVDYFLIVWDYINYARKNGIMVGPGRGSAAGSVVSYCLHITNIDPIRFQLLFERFLNPERISMPDIDVDFGYERRQEVIDYVTAKYGRDKVVQIITFGTMAARGVIRDVGRVMDLPYGFVDQIAKMVPNELGITLEKALKQNPDLRNACEEDEKVKHLIDMSRRLEGLPRHTSVHAAGVVICSEPAEDLVPLSLAQDGSVTTQFTMTAIEELGLLKMDFLGLRYLTVIQDAVIMADKERAKKGLPPIDIDAIDFDDPKVYASMATGHTDGVFQLESAGMQSFMKELKPESLEDLTAGISLYRPGPMDFIPQYISGKNNRSGITYLCPELEPILAPTYGCIVYQEQVMQIVRDLGGYTLGRSDLVRRAMSKKKQSVMEKERHNFVYGNPDEGVPGCLARGISEDAAESIFDAMMDFANYAFNKSHAACYAVVSYQTAWLKYYYPTQFMAALLTSVIDFPGKVAAYILTCRDMHINILPPDINAGETGFSVRDDQIVYALTAIKGIGRSVIDTIVAEREKNGKFRDLSDFIDRTVAGSREINKRVVENLIKAGAFDSFGVTRKQMMSVYLQLTDELTQSHKNRLSGQMSIFDLMTGDDGTSHPYQTVQYPDVGEYPRELMLEFEKDVLGLYVSGHPLEEYTALLRSGANVNAADFALDEETGVMKLKDGMSVTAGGMITAKTVKYTRNNQVMAFVNLEDLTGTVEVIVFPKSYETCSEKLNEGEKVFISGRVQADEDKDAKLICSQVQLFSERTRKLWLRFPDMDTFRARSEQVNSIINAHGGRDQVVLYIENPRSKKELPPGSGIKADEEAISLLKELLGEGNVQLV